MERSKQALEQIDKLYQGRQHVDLCIGTLADGRIETVHLGPNREEVAGALPVYPVGSICKLFTTSLLAKYLAAGTLQLEAPLSDYIPGLPKHYYPSLKKLATHSSGYGGTPFTLWTTLRMLAQMNRPDGILHVNPFHGTIREADMLRILGEKQLKDQVYKFEYSNFGMGVLGYILGKTDGRGYWDAMNAFIREDLGLANTYLGETAMTGYDKKGNPCDCWRWGKDDIIAPAGALISSVEDLLQFAQLHMDGTRPWLAVCHERQAGGEKTFESGLGWRLEKGTNISWHDGAAGAYSAFVGLDREKKTAVALAMNYAMVNTRDPAIAILSEL